MIAEIFYEDKKYRIDLSMPIDISIQLQPGNENLTAWYCPAPRFEPVMTEHFTGSVKLGGAVNFRDIYFNPHGHGTHTECLGHISLEDFFVNDLIGDFNMPAYLWTLTPEKLANNDDVIMPNQIIAITDILNNTRALIIRTLPNDLYKKNKQYSNSNPPYIHPDAMRLLVAAGIEHLMIDTVSVDREEDGGKLEGHHIFWNYPNNPRFHCSITELIYVADEIKDGLYWLQLGIANFKNDASPSRPLLFQIKNIM